MEKNVLKSELSFLRVQLSSRRAAKIRPQLAALRRHVGARYKWAEAHLYQNIATMGLCCAYGTLVSRAPSQPRVETRGYKPYRRNHGLKPVATNRIVATTG